MELRAMVEGAMKTTLNMEEWVTPNVAWELVEDPPTATFAFIRLRVAKHTGHSLDSLGLQQPASTEVVAQAADPQPHQESDRFAPPLFFRRGTLCHLLPTTTGPNVQRSRGRFDIFLGRNVDGNGALSWCDA